MGGRGRRINPDVRRERPLAPDVASRGLVAHVLVIDPSEVVYVKSLVEASEGLASIFAESGGTLTIASSESRAVELEGLLADVVAELDRDARQASWRRPEERRVESFGASELEPARCA